MSQSTKQGTNTIQYWEKTVDKLSSELEVYRNGVKSFRKLGYGLLILFLFDLVAILYPPHFLNPSWELMTFGKVVERVVVPLLGLTFVFLGKRVQRTRWENSVILPVLSILTLILAIVMFLLIPLGILDAVKLNNAYIKEVQLVVNNRQENIQAIDKLLKNVDTKSDMEKLMGQLISQQRLPTNLDLQQSMDRIKTELSKALVDNQESIPIEAEKILKSKQIPLLKNTVKWSFGSIIAGVLFINHWKWARWIWQP